MNKLNYLEQRTTNINIRISPMLKMQLIERGATQGLNLSDYVMHVLTVEMSGGNQPKTSDISEHEKYQNLVDELNEELAAKQVLQKEKAELQKELEVYEQLTKGFQSCIGQTMYIEGEQIKINSELDVLKIMVKTFKIKNL